MIYSSPKGLSKQKDKFNFKPPSSRRYWPFYLVAALLAFFCLIFFFFAKNYSADNWREIKNSASQTILKQKEIISEQPRPADIFGNKSAPVSTENFLLLGAAGPGYDAPDLTDTILIAHLDFLQKKVFLFSLPRDLLVKIPGSENWTKINALYAVNKKNPGREFDLILKKVQEISGLTVNHYVLVELATVKNLVDILNGINVMVKEDIRDPTFPGPNYSYQTFEIKAGWRYLDGETAIKYIRSRHSASGDFDRIERQQQVLQSLKQKVLQLGFWDLATYWKIFNTVASQIKTDLNIWQINDYWQQLKDIPAQDTVKTEINNAELITTGQTTFNGQTASIVKPKAGLENYKEIQEYVKKIIEN